MQVALQGGFVVRMECYSNGGRQRGGGFAAKKKANPASLRSAAPSKGRGKWGAGVMDGAQRRCIRDADAK